MKGLQHAGVLSFLTDRDRMAVGAVSKSARGDTLNDDKQRIRDIRLAVYLGRVTDAARTYDWAYSRNLVEFAELPYGMQTPRVFVDGLRRRGYRQCEHECIGNGLWLEMPCQYNWAREIRGVEDPDVLHAYASAYSANGRVIIQIDGALSPALAQLFYDFPGAPPDLAAYITPGHAAFPSGPVPRASVMTETAGPYADFYAVPTCHDEDAYNETACLEPGGCVFEGEALDARHVSMARWNKRTRLV